MPARTKAFLIHLAASVGVALLTLLLVFQVWYPAPLHEAVGVTSIFLLLLLVDLALGPLLTLIVYKPGKKSLAFDLSVVVLLQLSALGYGLWAVAEGRPAWLVFNADRFDVVRALDIDQRQAEAALPQYRSAPWSGPRWVAADHPRDIKERQGLMFEAITLGSDIAQRPELYRPVTDMADAIRRKAKPLGELSKYNSAERVSMQLQNWPAADAWLPLAAGARSMVVLLNREGAEVVAIVDLQPWSE